MARYRLFLVGFCVVGQGFMRLLTKKMAHLAQTEDFQAQIVGVYTRRASLYAPQGLEMSLLLAAAESGSIAHYPDQPGVRRDLDALTMLSQADYDVLIEVTPTDFTTGEPALSHMRTALNGGKAAITVNKGPLALAYRELAALARDHRTFLGYEGTVMGGTPCIRLAEAGLAGSLITAIRGVLNATTNYILQRMEAGVNYAEALAEAQQLGYAETDPTADVEGYDAAGKITIFANLLLGGSLRPEQVERTGITGLSAADMVAARDAGERWKLIAAAWYDGGKVVASVKPVRLRLDDPLANVATNGVIYTTDTLGDVTLIGAGAGGEATGFAILTDLLAFHKMQSGRVS